MRAEVEGEGEIWKKNGGAHETSKLATGAGKTLNKIDWVSILARSVCVTVLFLTRDLAS